MPPQTSQIKSPETAAAAAETPSPPPPPPAPSANWRAELRLRVDRDGARSVLASKRAHGPLVALKPLYPEGGGVCHLCLIHPPGGVVGGDRLRLDLEVRARAAALITTPGAAKFYRAAAAGALARVRNDLRVGEGAALEFLPQDAIAFAGCRAAVDTVVRVDTGAKFIGWDMLCLGRPAAGDWYTAGRFDGRLRIECDGEPRLIERNRYHAGDGVLRDAWGLGGRTVTGALYALPADADALAELRERLRVGDGGDDGEMRFAATVIGNVLVLRCIAADAEACRALLIKAWKILRPPVLNRPAIAPRIWNT